MLYKNSFSTFAAMNVVKSITVKATSYLLIGLIALLIANKAIYIHTHKLPNGTIVVHAHPFNKSCDTEPFKSHKHTKGELYFFQSIENLFPLLFLISVFISLPGKKIRRFLFLSQYIPVLLTTHDGRAPPVS